MQKKRYSTLVITLALAVLAADVMAMGFGAVSTSATLGQGLDHVIGLRLDPGESLSPECVSADVMIGEQRVPAAAVRTRLEGDAANPVLRVQTVSIVDEPLVSVSVSLGCPSRLSRRFTLFADPAPILAPNVPVAVPAEAVPPAAPASSPLATAAPEVKPAVAPARARRTESTTAAAPRVARTPRPALRRAQEAPAASTAVAAARPRLKLDVAEPTPPPPAITAEVVEAAASAAAAQAAALATSAAASRISALEQSIEKLRAESQADREALRLLRQKAAEVDAVSAWMPWLAALSAGLAALALWLAFKLRRLQRERQQAWWQAGAAAAAAADKPGTPPGETRAEPTTTAEASLGAGPSTGGYSTTRPGTLGPVFATELPSVSTLNEPPLSVGEQTQALPVGWRDDEPARDVSIEELIDLEQQAEFFIVLGQEEAAVDLLVDHLRSTGGGSPMPYLKLLEIYRRRGDREAYDRMRARFNHRFNAYAPDWDNDATEGRSLEDYPSIVARLQMAWPSPIDAMAELESLLFRKTRGELFDMPAYRDVLFLYSLARDLLDREPLETGNVDVLLPISDSGHSTQPMSLDDLPPAYESGLVPLDNAPTVPVDLDVTQPAVPESLFGETATEPGPTGGGRRRR